MNPLKKALGDEARNHLIQRNELSGSRWEEVYSDGSRRFAGAGSGILWMLSTGVASIAFDRKPTGQNFETLLFVASQMPNRPVEILDLKIYKGESQLLLESLRTRNAQFFRELAEAIQPTPSRTKRMKEHSSNQRKKDDEVHESIMAAANKIEGLPSFPQILEEYRGRANAGEMPAQFRKKLRVRGFEWLCES